MHLNTFLGTGPYVPADSERGLWHKNIRPRYKRTYSEGAGKADDCVLRGNINRCTSKGSQAQDGGDVDHHATVAPFVLTHVLEPQ